MENEKTFQKKVNLLSKKLKSNPVKIANNIKDDLGKLTIFKKIMIVNPGFINFYINPENLYNYLDKIMAQKSNYGKNNSCKGNKALVEFVSANPTGPLTVGHGRGAILGDTISNILSWNGYSVKREYYYNNAGKQMKLLGDSVKARYLELLGVPFDFPKDGYEGEYIKDISRKIFKKYNKSLLNNTETNNIFIEEAETFILRVIVHLMKLGQLLSSMIQIS